MKQVENHWPETTCFNNNITPLMIALENCSNPQKTQQVFKSTMKTNFGVLGFRFFVSDIILGKF